MPYVLDPVLHLERQPDGKVKIDFLYSAYFSPNDRIQILYGIRFEETVEIFGVDPPGSTRGTPLITFVGEIVGVTYGQFYLIKNRPFTWTVPRALLDEDAIPNVDPDVDPDEIRCRVEIRSFLPSVVAWSNEEVLGLRPPIEDIESAEVQNDEVKTIEIK